MKILHISDTHGTHDQFVVGAMPDADVIVHSGDATNNRIPALNHNEFLDFVEWYKFLPYQYKIYVAGNHDTFIYNNKKEAEGILEEAGIIYLNKQSCVIGGLTFYGDPTTPRYGDWAFMCKRESIVRHWDIIPEDTEILITHGPPKYILDINGELDSVGDSALYKRIMRLRHIRACLFGHIHDNRKIKNHGVLYRDGIIYSNAAAVVDGRIGKLENRGNIIEL